MGKEFLRIQIIIIAGRRNNIIERILWSNIMQYYLNRGIHAKKMIYVLIKLSRKEMMFDYKIKYVFQKNY